MELRARLQAKSVTLKKDDVEKLCHILEKATEGDTSAQLSFTLSEKESEVSYDSTEELLAGYWPRDIESGKLEATSYGKGRIIRWVFNNEVPYSNITIMGGADID